MKVTFEKLTIDDNSTFLYKEFIQAHYTSPLHVHDEFELILIKQSHGKLFIGSTVHNFNDNSLYLFAPGLSHCFYNPKDYEKEGILAHAIVIQFKADFLGKEFIERIECTNLKNLFKKAEQGIQFLSPSNELINRILDIKQKSGINRIIDLLALLNALSVKKKFRLLTSNDQALNSEFFESKRIADVYCYVGENFNNEITLEKAASVANMQKAAFCRYFKRKTKKTFSEFVNEVRIAHSLKLLVETDKTTTEICFECGFNNVSYFHRQFKLFQKTSPLEMRRLKYEEQVE
jgi:AraC-like DNA-binding protein